MKFSMALSAGTLAAIIAQSHAAFLQTNPMTRVAALLNEMKSKIETDGQQEQASYDQYACWCEDTLSTKAQDISSAKEEIETLQRDIIRLNGELASHAVEVKQLEKDITANKESQREAAQIRDKENVAYEADKTESEQCLGALDAAIKVLANPGKGFLETMKDAQLLSVAADVRIILEKPVTVHRVDGDDLQLVKRFVDRPQDFIGSSSHIMSAAQTRANPYGDYAPRSTKIQGILKSMHDSFTENLQSAIAEETKAQKAFVDLMQTKVQELSTLQATLGQQELSHATKTNTLAQNNEQLDDTKVQLAADEAFFAETKSGCKEKATQWSERTRLRSEELTGLNQAITILTDPDSMKVFENSSTTFVQISSISDKDKKRMAAFASVATLAKKFHSYHLAQLAVLVKTGGHFDKVISAVDQMIVTLREEAQDDIDHRDRCQSSETKNGYDIEDLNGAISKADAAKTRFEGEQTDLQGKVGSLDDEINKTKQEMVTLIDMRVKAVADFKQALQYDASAITLLDQAIEALTNFYRKNGIALSFIDPRPEVNWGADYSSHGAQTRGVVAILEMLREDIEKEMHVARKDDTESQKVFEAERKAIDDSLDAQETVKRSTEKELLDVESKIADTDDHKFAKSKDLDAANEQKDVISADCSWVASHFETRRTKREAEIQGLIDAKGYLAGVDSMAS